MGIVRWIIVTITAVVLTTLGINAFDNAGTYAQSLIGAVFLAGGGERCPSDMAFVSTSEGGFCVDIYEASAGESCIYKDPQSKKETDDNLAFQKCKPVSERDSMPWRYISRQQAELACAKAEKRLPVSKEWYRAVLGTVDKSEGWGNNDCNVDSVGAQGPEFTGSRNLCVSPIGAYDMIGNVWEWIEETVYEGKYNDVLLPPAGYIKSISEKGIPIKTNQEGSDQSFFNDYFWAEPTDIRGVFRGGYWGNQSDAGQYAVNVTVPPSFVGGAVGFRCVKEPNIKSN